MPQQQLSLSGLKQIILKVNTQNGRPLMLLPPELKNYPAVLALFAGGKDIVEPERGVEFKKVMDKASFQTSGGAGSVKIRVRHLVYLKK